MKFLIADDSGHKHDQLLQFIDSHWPEAEVLHAYSTEEGEEMIKAHADISAGFIDYQMPTHNGPWLIKKWRELEKDRSSRAIIVLATGQGGSLFTSFAKEARQSGADMAVSTLDSMKGSGRHLGDAAEILLQKIAP